MKQQLDEAGVYALVAAISPILREDWVNDALCAQVGWADFFPDDNEGRFAAKSICRRCAVADRCLDYSVTEVEVFGIWSGTSPKERKKIRSAQRLAAA